MHLSKSSSEEHQSRATKKRHHRSSRFASYRLLKPILGQYYGKIGQALVALLSAAGATLAFPMMIRYIGDAGVMENVVLLQQGFLGLFMLLFFNKLANKFI